jgi:hypothetical protein
LVEQREPFTVIGSTLFVPLPVTVRVVEPEMFPEVAVIVVVPVAIEVALPFDPVALLMVATDAAEEAQLTDAVRPCVLLSEKVPVAVNCCVVPRKIEGLAGVTAIETRVTSVTVRVVEPEMFPDVAVIVVVPAAIEAAFPFDPAVLLMVAIDSVEEVQITDVVRSCVLLSEKVPMAVNCCVVPRAMEGLAGWTVIDASTMTVKTVEPEIPLDLAEIVVVPAPTAVTIPFDLTPLLMVATDLPEEVQITDVVRSSVLLSEKVPVAVNCCVVPFRIEGLTGVTAIEISLLGAASLILPPPQTVARVNIRK